MPFAAAMRCAVLQLHSSGTDCRILSDANTFFISSFLKSQGIDHCFTHVVSNPATWTHGVLRVAPLTPWGESQPCGFSCPENMCKASANMHQRLLAMYCIQADWAYQGSVVSQWMKERDWAGVCYVGDGSGDICGRSALEHLVPCFNLNLRCSAATGVLASPSTLIFAREKLALHRGIERLLQGRGSSCGVLRTWSTYEQLHSLLQEWV